MTMAKKMSAEDMGDYLVDNGYCSVEFLNGAVCVGGVTRQTMERVLTYITGWTTSFESFVESEED